MAGQEQFCGFSIKVPFSPEIKISIELSSGLYHWKTLAAKPFQSDLPLHITNVLCHGATSDVEAFPDSTTVTQTLDYLHGSTRAYWFNEFDDLPLEAGEKGFFLAFLEYLSSARFFHDVLGINRQGAPKIRAPFSMGESTFLGSIFAQINYLVFAVEGERFYIGQNLHSANFVYIPSRSFVSISPQAKYVFEHLKGLFECAINTPTKFAAGESANVRVGEVAINGVSPYHFFYDALPAFYMASQTRRLKPIAKFHAINSHCYAPLRAIGDTPGEWLPATDCSLAEQSRGLGFDALCVAGVNYKALSETDLYHMDEELLVHALSVTEFSKRYAAISSYGFVVWIGISTQKRAWINQKEALVALLTRLYNTHESICVVFDGMTANIFDDCTDSTFADDAAIVAEIVAALPEALASYSLVGRSGSEKMFVASKCHFFVANYSTGSMYPARFCSVPGVGHLSHSLLQSVKSIHIHPNTQLVPPELVIDVPDKNSRRVDFVSYTIDTQAFCDFVESVLISSAAVPSAVRVGAEHREIKQ